MIKRYRIDTFRAQWWDYSSKATYFITINTKYAVPYFGEVENGKMKLSEIGSFVNEEWLKSVDLRPQMKLVLHNFVVMPDHFHGLISIDTSQITSLEAPRSNQFKSQSNNLASVIRGFKSAVTQRCRVSGLEFDWHPRFHDVIVRDHEQFAAYQEYIENNPLNYRKK